VCGRCESSQREWIQELESLRCEERDTRLLEEFAITNSELFR